jgi:arylsulfatase A-like enzyme
MTQHINRRDFLKISGALIASAGVAGWGIRNTSNSDPHNTGYAAIHQVPNVLLIVLDTVRANSLSLYGYEQPTTPNLERLAKQGVVFTRAIAPSSWTLPSHASIFTGQRPFKLSADWYSRLDSAYPTLADVMRQKGYQTSGFSGNLTYCTKEFGLARGFDTFSDFKLSYKLNVSTVASLQELTSEKYLLGQMVRENIFKHRKSSEQIRGDFITWLDRRDEKKPFFTFINFMDAHDPYISPKPFYSQFVEGKPRFFAPHRVRYAPDTKTMKELNDAYDGCIAYLDHQIESLTLDLAKRNLLDNTLVIITADHGEHFGDHGLYNHGNSLYMNSVNVPLIMLYPGNIPSGTVINQTVSLISLASTISDIAGIDHPDTFSGKSLTGFWQASPPDEMVRSEATIFDWKAKKQMSYARAKSLFYEDWHYIRLAGGTEELYDINRDYEEKDNLVDKEEAIKPLKLFRAAIV